MSKKSYNYYMYLKNIFSPIVKVEKKIGSRKNQEMEQTETDGILTSKKYTFFSWGTAQWTRMENITQRQVENY